MTMWVSSRGCWWAICSSLLSEFFMLSLLMIVCSFVGALKTLLIKMELLSLLCSILVSMKIAISFSRVQSVRPSYCSFFFSWIRIRYCFRFTFVSNVWNVMSKNEIILHLTLTLLKYQRFRLKFYLIMKLVNNRNFSNTFANNFLD